MYLAALAAGSAMAQEVNDQPFSKRCERILTAGRENIMKELFNGEYSLRRACTTTVRSGLPI